jgi:hypothetical protein
MNMNTSVYCKKVIAEFILLNEYENFSVLKKVIAKFILWNGYEYLSVGVLLPQCNTELYPLYLQADIFLW